MQFGNALRRAVRDNSTDNDRSMIAKPDVCVVSVPVLAFNEKVGLDNFVRLLLPSCNRILVITGDGFQQSYDDRVFIKKIRILFGTSPVAKVIHKIVDQMRETLCLIGLSRNFHIVLFHAGVYFNQLPILAAKLLRKRVVVYQFGGNYLLEQKLSATRPWERIAKPINAAFSRINYPLADVIICEGRKYLMQWDQLGKYQSKIAWLVARDMDLTRFRIIKPIHERPNVIGYFGRLDPKKGIINFIRAIPLVLKVRKDVKFIIAGTGPLRDEIEREIESLKAMESVALVGFVREEDIPLLLNQLKLLVLPTYDDGIPEVLKEAMACGTLVVATPIGGIPDIVKDGVHAFIIHKNDSDGVAKAILEAISSPDIDKVALRGRALIEEIYETSKMAQRYQDMLQKALGNSKQGWD